MYVKMAKKDYLNIERRVIHDYEVSEGLKPKPPLAHRVAHISYIKPRNMKGELKIKFEDGGEIRVTKYGKEVCLDANSRVVGMAWGHKLDVPNYYGKVRRRMQNISPRVKTKFRRILPLEAKMLWNEALEALDF